MTTREVGVGGPYRGAALPMYGVDTKEEAEDLKVLLCKFSYTGEYFFPGFGGEVEDIEKTGLVFQAMHEQIKRRKESDQA